MDLLLNDESEAGDDEVFRKRLLEELDQVSIDDAQTEKSFIQFDQTAPVVNEFQNSKTWLEFLASNNVRDKMLEDIEEKIQIVKQINRGNAIVEVEDDFGQKIQLPVLNAIDEQKLQQIRAMAKEQTKQDQDLKKEPNEDFQVSFPSIPSPSPTQKPAAFAPKRQQDHTIRLAQMMEQRETMFMEVEDELATEFRLQEWKRLFAHRLFVLPQEFPKLEPMHAKKIKMPNLKVPDFSTPAIKIPQIQEFTESNLAPNNTKELVFERLKSIKFKNLNFTQREHTPKNTQAAQVRIEEKLDSELKYNIVYQDHKKHESQQKLSATLEEIKFRKISNVHSDIMAFIQRVYQLPEYKPYKSPFVEFETPKTNLDEMQSEGEDGLSQFEVFIRQNQIKQKSRLIEIKLENLVSVEGIQRFTNLRVLTLSANSLSDLQPVASLQSLLEINLSQNKIQSYSCLGKLHNLRVLNLEMNQIREISPLKQCKFLEIYRLNGNSIQGLSNLENLIFLKQLHVFKNQVKWIGFLDNNLLLEVLDLGSNQVEIKPSENPFKSLQCLRKLILYKNRISTLPDMRLLNLVELHLSKNLLESLNGLNYLPSLQILQVKDNQLQACYDLDQQLAYLPNLQILDLSGNKIQSFGTIQNFIQNSRHLREINYADNPFLFQLSNDVFQLYRYLLNLNCENIKKVNDENLEQVDIEFLAGKFSGFFKKPQKPQVNQLENNLLAIGAALSENHKQMQKLNQLEQRKLQKPHQICYTEQFKVIQVTNDFLFLKNNFKSPFNIDAEIARFEQRYQRAQKKVHSFLIKWIYLHRKMKKHYVQKMGQLVRAQAMARGYLLRKRPEVQGILNKRRARKKDKFALKIQKVFRGYRIRKRMKNLLANIKFEDPELDAMNEVNIDDDFFQQDMNMNFDLKIPSGIDLQQIFSQQQVQQKQQQQQSQQYAEVQEKIRQKVIQQTQPQQHQKVPSSAEQQMRTSHISQQSKMQSSKFSEKTNQTDQLPKIQSKQKVSVNQIMQNWNLKDPQVAQTIALKLEKDRKRKMKVKELTTEEKLQRFRQLAHKN